MGKGQAETVAKLKERVRSPETVTKRLEKQLLPDKSTRSTLSLEQRLHNPFAGVLYAWQLEESVDDFVRRITPSKTTANERTPCIYICNPHIRRGERTQSESQLIPGCSDEGTDTEEGMRTVLFVKGAKERLDILADFLRGLTGMDAPSSTLTHDADTARQAAVKDILGLAGHLGVTCGKVRPARQSISKTGTGACIPYLTNSPVVDALRPPGAG